MKVGDLVRFTTSAPAFRHAKKKYSNPGIVLRATKSSNEPGGNIFRILWADKKITSEYRSFLKEWRG